MKEKTNNFDINLSYEKAEYDFDPKTGDLTLKRSDFENILPAKSTLRVKFEDEDEIIQTYKVKNYDDEYILLEFVG